MISDPVEAARAVRQMALSLGFQRCGIAPAAPIERADYLRAWLAAGRAGSMAYLHRYLDQRLDPRNLLDGAMSIVVVALSYHQPSEAMGGLAHPVASPPRGRVAMYAWGDDYHKVVKKKLFALADAMRERHGDDVQTRACVDTAPLLEREVAAAAGVGWIGKNTLVLHQDLGSYFFLGTLLTTLDLEPDESATDHCGTCTRCLDACPTDAFPAPYEMDASRCISYLTIERRKDIPKEFHAGIGDWLFGCDVCQQVCPYNLDAPATNEVRFSPDPQRVSLDPGTVAQWSDEDYQGAVRGSAMKRATLDMLKRNALIVRENHKRGVVRAD